MKWTIEHQRLLKRLRFKYECNLKMSSLLDNVVWFSVYSMYPDFIFQSKEVRKELHKLCERRRRIRSYLDSMVRTFSDVYLLSLTFEDSVLDTTDFKTRKKYCTRYLNSTFDDYFACVDFGKLNGREHYHALVCNSHSLYVYSVRRGKEFLKFADSSLDWPYGFMSIVKIKSSGRDLHSSLNYAFKSSYYAFKSADSLHKPFHKRGVEHAPPGWINITDTFFC